MSGEKKPANVFANRNFRLVFLGALVSELGAILYSFAVGFYILEISDNNAFLQGLYLALCGIVSCCCSHQWAGFWGIGSTRQKSCMSAISSRAG